ncbi:hypothetical protein CF326_g8572 [Tilletia indica]|nr:hypothetical protein CF326_g8572 [Tilletia indica]
MDGSSRSFDVIDQGGQLLIDPSERLHLYQVNQRRKFVFFSPVRVVTEVVNGGSNGLNSFLTLSSEICCKVFPLVIVLLIFGCPSILDLPFAVLFAVFVVCAVFAVGMAPFGLGPSRQASATYCSLGSDELPSRFSAESSSPSDSPAVVIPIRRELFRGNHVCLALAGCWTKFTFAVKAGIMFRGLFGRVAAIGRRRGIGGKPARRRNWDDCGVGTNDKGVSGDEEKYMDDIVGC